MFIKLTVNQRTVAQKFLMPECATRVGGEYVGSEIEPDVFWNCDWYIVDEKYNDVPTTIEEDYPYSVQTLYAGCFYEIDVISEKCLKSILEVK